jgi:hypothetical protein
MKWLKNFDRLLEIQRNIVWPSVLELDPKQVGTHLSKRTVACTINQAWARLRFSVSLQRSNEQSREFFSALFKSCICTVIFSLSRSKMDKITGEE